MSEERQLNPEIKTIVYGKKELNELTLYPLSIGDQFKVTDTVTEIIKQLVTAQNEGTANDFVLVSLVMESLEKNINKILSLVIDQSIEETEKITAVMTNNQLMEVVETIWLVNFEPALKKGKDLFERGKNLFNLKKSSPDSSNPILNTESKMSIEKTIGKED